MPRSSSCSIRRLRGKPIAVGGGVVLAASYEAKAFGVRGGMPGRRARELCPQLIFVGGHFKDYQRLGDAAIKVLGDFTPLVERISIDEAFADVAGCTHLFGPPAEIAGAIRRRVRAELGLPISVGVARTKHLAKIASQVAKPDGLVVVDPARELDFLHDLPVELMWGVGPVTRARLAEIGVLTIGQLAKTAGTVARAIARSRGGREAHGAGVESRSAGNQDASAGAFGRRPVGARQEACRRARLPPHAAPSRRPGRHPAARQIPARPDRDGPRSLRRSALGHALGNARRADFGDRDPRRDRRGAGARGRWRITRTRSTISLLAISVSHLEEDSELQLELPLGLDGRGAPPRHQKRAWRAAWPTAPSTAIRDRFGWDGGRIRVGRVGNLPLRSRRVSRARRKGAVADTGVGRLTSNSHVVYMHDMASESSISPLAQSLLDTCLCHNARMASRVITRAYDEALRPTGLRATQVAVLAAVGARGALSIKSLANSLEMERTTLTRNLRPLEEQGHVAIAPEGRHRSRVLTLTKSGQAALLKALPLWQAAPALGNAPARRSALASRPEGVRRPRQQSAPTLRRLDEGPGQSRARGSLYVVYIHFRKGSGSWASSTATPSVRSPHSTRPRPERRSRMPSRSRRW